jgi:hypothetical protein
MQAAARVTTSRRSSPDGVEARDVAEAAARCEKAAPRRTAFCRREGCAWGFAGLWSASMSVSPLFARRRRWTASPRSDVALALVLGVERRIALAAGGATGVALVIAAVAGKGVSTAGFAAAMYAVFAVAWALGDNVRTRRAYLVEVEARAERLELSEAAGLVTNIADEYARVASALATARAESRRA